MGNKNLREKANQAYVKLSQALSQAITDLTEIVKANGGKILTPPSMDKPTIYAYTYGNIDNSALDTETIQAIAYDEVEGLMVITETEMSNYEYDNGYQFEYTYDYEGEDKEHYEDMVKDLTYFRELDDSHTAMYDTIFSILCGLESYLA